MGFFKTIIFLIVATSFFQGSHADSVTYGDLGTFEYGDGAPECHRVMPESPEAIMTHFWLYTTSNPDTPQEIIRTSATSITNSNFDASRDTKFIIHGYLDFYFMPWHQDMKNAFLTHDFNVIMVDWHEGGSRFPEYPLSAANTRVVGREIGKLIEQLLSVAGAPYSSMHIIGHSLGAQTAGYAGEARPGVARISGLDPAGPAFRGYGAVCRLDPTDADFVDVIHTDGEDSKGYGLLDKSGHQDFYPNGGHTQPGCDDSNFINPCDHLRVVPLYTESITSTCKFTATTQCDDFYSYPSCPACDSCPEMGYHAGKEVGSGFYFLDTHGASPFCI